MTCPRCERVIKPSDLRVEDVPMSRDEPGHSEKGCRYCLRGRHVYRLSEVSEV